MRIVRNILLAFSVLWFFLSCGTRKAEKLQQLEILEQVNRTDSVMNNDSLAEELVAYFDKYGSPNEQLRARYILGRTYFDLGELPRALETYLKAADCADTTATDCDYKTLSKVYGQKAVIYYEQIQPRSQLNDLHLAIRYARKCNDTLMAIEFYALQVEAYSLLKERDSVIYYADKAANMFRMIGRNDRASQMLSSEITSLIHKGSIDKAKKCIDSYEAHSCLFNENGDIVRGREIYYYLKGKYYLAVNKLDSAEEIFRKELRYGKDLNNQIGGNKGLQEVFEKKRITDSIAKYATLTYELNDSVYSLSEMQNIQKLQASYNYNHNKYLTEQKKMEAKMLLLLLLFVIVAIVIIGILFIHRYYIYKKAALDYRLRNADISQRFREMSQQNTARLPSFSDWRELKDLIENEIPSFYRILNPDMDHLLTDFEYDVCLALRIQLSPIEIARLKQCSPSYITKVRKKLLLQIFNREDNADVFDDEIVKIRKHHVRKMRLPNIVKSFYRHFF